MIGAQSMETIIHCKKRLSIFPSPAWMPLTKLSLAGNNLNFPSSESLVSDIPAGDGKIIDLFLQCTVLVSGWKLCWGHVNGNYCIGLLMETMMEVSERKLRKLGFGASEWKITLVSR